MSDMSNFWKQQKKEYKIRCNRRNQKYEPLLIKLGATRKSDSVYMISGWFCYPTKGFAMQQRTNKKMNLDKFLKIVEENSKC